MKTSKVLTIGEKRELIYELFKPENNKVIIRLMAYADKKYNEYFKKEIYCTSKDIFYESVTELICQTKRSWNQSKYPNAVSQIFFVFFSILRNRYKEEIIDKTAVKEEKDLYEKKLEDLEPEEKELIKDIFGDENFDPNIVDQSRRHVPIPLVSGVFINDEVVDNFSSEKILVDPCDPVTVEDLIQKSHNQILYNEIIEYFNSYGTENQKNVLCGMNSNLTESKIAKKYNLTPDRVNKIKEQIRTISARLYSSDEEVSTVYKVRIVDLKTNKSNNIIEKYASKKVNPDLTDVKSCERNETKTKESVNKVNEKKADDKNNKNSA
jgi:hypothetical protein